MASSLKLLLLLVVLMTYTQEFNAADMNETEIDSSENNENTESPMDTCLPLEVLDFLQFNSENRTEVQILEKKWPCEVRTYWLHIQGLVSVVRFLFTYVTVVLVLFGLLVNLASLGVLSSPPINTSSISVYLRALAISDIGAMVFNVSVGYLRAHSQKVNDFYLENSTACFLQRTLSNVFFYYSTWLVVALTFKRLFMIKFPFHDFRFFNFRPSSCVVVILAIASLVIAVARTQVTGFEKDNMYGYKPCGSAGEPSWNYIIILFLSLSTILPTTLIFIGNIWSLLHIRRSGKDLTDLQASKKEGVNAFKITRILLLISMMYLMLLLPVGIVGSIELYWRSFYQKHPHNSEEAYINWKKKMMLIKWIRGFLFLVFLLNYNINFFLYCISGKTFRETVKICLRRWLPTYCQCFCLQQTSMFATGSEKHRTLVTSLSNLTLKQSERRISGLSMNSKQGQHNFAFENSERTLNKLDSTLRTPQ